jgi:hypothetical protein
MPFHRFAIPGLASPFRCVAVPGSTIPCHRSTVQCRRFASLRFSVTKQFVAFPSLLDALPRSSFALLLGAIPCYSFAFHVISFPIEPPPIHCIANPANPQHCLSLLCLFSACPYKAFPSHGISVLCSAVPSHGISILRRCVSWLILGISAKRISIALLCHSMP